MSQEPQVRPSDEGGLSRSMSLLDGLDYEDREVAVQTISASVPRLTEMQLRCLTLLLLGRTQHQAAQILGVTQRTVAYHFRRALEAVESEAVAFR